MLSDVDESARRRAKWSMLCVNIDQRGIQYTQHPGNLPIVEPYSAEVDPPLEPGRILPHRFESRTVRSRYKTPTGLSYAFYNAIKNNNTAGICTIDKATQPDRRQLGRVLGAAKASRVAQDSALYRGQPITATYNFTDAERKLSPRLAHVDSVVMQYIPLGNVPHGCHFGATDKELHSLLNHAMAYMEEEQWVCGRFHLVSHASGEAILQIAGSVNGHTTDSCWIF